MNKVKLTESQLHDVIKESVKKALNEIGYPTHPNNKREYIRKGDPKDNEKWSESEPYMGDDTPRNPLDDRVYFNEGLNESDDYNNDGWENAYSLDGGKIAQQRGDAKHRQFRTVNKPMKQSKPFNDDYNNDGWENAYKLGNGKIVQQRGDAKHRQFRTINESKLCSIIKESIDQVLNEFWGGSSASSSIAFDSNNQAYAKHQQGGGLGVSNLDLSRAQDDYNRRMRLSRQNQDAEDYMNGGLSKDREQKLSDFCVRWNRSNPQQRISYGTACQWLAQGKLTEYPDKIVCY